jgi:ankyrin repeat protein
VSLSNLYNLKKRINYSRSHKNPNRVFFLITKMSSESLPLVPASTTLPIPPPHIPWTLADEEALIKRENAISHLQLCIARRDQCEIDLISFRRKYSETVINADPILHSRHILLINARKEAWEAYFKAYDALYPKTIEDILWIMAKAGHTKLVAPLMNLSKVTRTCIHLQPIMMNVKLGRYGETQLHHCARKGLTSSVKRLLSIRNINVNVKDDEYGWTPLHDAARKDNVEITRLLLQNGADVNAKTVRSNRTPLHFASDCGNFEIAQLLLQKGADVNAISKNGSSPLHLAIEESNLHVDIVKLLLEKGADVNARKSGETPLCLAALINYRLASFSDSNNDLDSDSNNDLDSDSNNDLDSDSNNDLDSDSNNDLDSDSNSKLNNDLVEIVKLLLEYGAEVNVRNENGETPLHSASTNGQFEITNLLLKNEADVNARNENGETPLCEVASKYFKHCRRENSNFSERDHKEYCQIFFKIIELLVENGADVDVEYNRDNGWSLLHGASCYGLDDLIELLCNNGANINIRTVDGDMTPLHIAAELYRSSIVSQLVERGADVNARTADGKTPLHFAADKNINIEIILHFAAENFLWDNIDDNIGTIQILIENGANVNARTADGKTALTIAQSNNYTRIAAFLQKNGGIE